MKQYTLFKLSTAFGLNIMITLSSNKNDTGIDYLPSVEEKQDIDISANINKKSRRPSKYVIILLNDDFTPMDLVVFILQNFFAKSLEESTEIMLAVHHHGSGVCGEYPYDIAETKVSQVTEYAKKRGSPLRCRLEKVK